MMITEIKKNIYSSKFLKGYDNIKSSQYKMIWEKWVNQIDVIVASTAKIFPYIKQSENN